MQVVEVHVKALILSPSEQSHMTIPARNYRCQDSIEMGLLNAAPLL